MFALEITDTVSWLQARILRMLLESDGYPAVAVEVQDGDHTHIAVVSHAPRRAPHLLGLIAGMYAQSGSDEGVKLTEQHIANIRATRGGDNPLAIPKQVRDILRGALLTSIQDASKKEGMPVVRFETNPAEVPTPNHDSGDEHTEPVHNPEGGGWDSRCIDRDGTIRNMTAEERDAWDSFKPARDVG